MEMLVYPSISIQKTKGSVFVMTITANNISIVSIAVAETIKQLQENNLLKGTTEQNEKRELLSVKEIVDLYPNLSESSIREAINGMGLKYIKMGKILVDRKDLEEFLDKQKQAEIPLIDRVSSKFNEVNINGIINKKCNVGG